MLLVSLRLSLYTLSIFGPLCSLLFILSSLQVSQQAAKCIPAMVCPELTEQIRREVAASLHQRKGDFTCYFLTDLVTFTLPAGQYIISKQTKKYDQNFGGGSQLKTTVHSEIHEHEFKKLCFV